MAAHAQAVLPVLNRTGAATDQSIGSSVHRRRRDVSRPLLSEKCCHVSAGGKLESLEPGSTSSLLRRTAALACDSRGVCCASLRLPVGKASGASSGRKVNDRTGLFAFDHGRAHTRRRRHCDDEHALPSARWVNPSRCRVPNRPASAPAAAAAAASALSDSASTSEVFAIAPSVWLVCVRPCDGCTVFGGGKAGTGRCHFRGSLAMSRSACGSAPSRRHCYCDHIRCTCTNDDAAHDRITAVDRRSGGIDDETLDGGSVEGKSGETLHNAKDAADTLDDTVGRLVESGLVHVEGSAAATASPVEGSATSAAAASPVVGSDGELGAEEKGVLQILQRWNVPWDGNETTLGMVGWLVSFVATGYGVAVAAAKLGLGSRANMDLDSQSVFILVNQSVQTVVGLLMIMIVVKPFEPLPKDLFVFDYRKPLRLKDGWLLWAGIGVISAMAAVQASVEVVTAVFGEAPSREKGEALVQLLPLIGISTTTTTSLLAVTGLCAPLLEEVIFRGFLMTSLTKWVPTPLAVVLSSCAFAAAHFTPSEFPQLASLGLVLGFSYAQTRNLLTPIIIHSLWNSGIIIVLTLLRINGYDIADFINS